MKDTKRSARGLEDVSHFFLSRHSSEKNPDRASDNKGPSGPGPLAEPLNRHEPPQSESPSESGHPKLKSAIEVNSAGIPSRSLLRAARTYLRRSDVYKDAMVVENIDSPKFGSSDLLLVNKTRTRIVCAKLARGKNCEAFVVSAIAYYVWLKELMEIGAPLFGKQALLDMCLFANGFPEAIPYVMTHCTWETGIHLIKYNIFRVEELSHPVVRFRPVIPDPTVQQRPELPKAQKESAPPDKNQQASDPPDDSRQEWEAFQRLKERALT